MKNAGDRNLAYYLNLKYPVQIVECDEGGYFVKIPDLPGCLTQGETIEEALKNIKEAKELWLESAFEDKAEIPLPADERGYSGKFIVRLPASLHERLALAAEREGVSLNQHVATLLAERNALKEVETSVKIEVSRICAQVNSRIVDVVWGAQQMMPAKTSGDYKFDMPVQKWLVADKTSCTKGGE